MRKYINIFNVFIVLILISGCRNVKQTTNPELQVYDNFTAMDISNEVVYFEKNYYEKIGYTVPSNTEWLRVITQNNKINDEIFKIKGKGNISFDYSGVIFENGKSGYLKLIYDYSENDRVTKDIKVEYIDLKQTLDGNDTNINLYYKKLSHIYDGYILNFTVFDRDYYLLTIFNESKNIQEYHYEKYNGEKTFYINNKPALKILKDRVGYRIDALNYDNTEPELNKITKNFVFSLEEKSFFQGSAGDIDTYEGDISYSIKNISYDEQTQNFTVVLTSIKDDRSSKTDLTFTTQDFETIIFTEKNSFYTIEITKVDSKIVNITFKCNYFNNNRLKSYSLPNGFSVYS